jgi:Zn-dependent protease
MVVVSGPLLLQSAPFEMILVFVPSFRQELELPMLLQRGFVGPLTNLAMGFLFLISAYSYPYHSYLYAGASFNAWIALFNLLPFGVLDGQKIFDWNKIAWVCTMATTMTLFIISHF